MEANSFSLWYSYKKMTFRKVNTNIHFQKQYVITLDNPYPQITLSTVFTGGLSSEETVSIGATDGDVLFDLLEELIHNGKFSTGRAIVVSCNAKQALRRTTIA